MEEGTAKTTKAAGGAVAAAEKARAEARAREKAEVRKAREGGRTVESSQQQPPPPPPQELPELAGKTGKPSSSSRVNYAAHFLNAPLPPEVEKASAPPPPRSDAGASSHSSWVNPDGSVVAVQNRSGDGAATTGAVAVQGIGLSETAGTTDLEAATGVEVREHRDRPDDNFRDEENGRGTEGTSTTVAPMPPTAPTDAEVQVSNTNESQFLVPSAYAVDNIVEAQSVAREDQLVHPSDLPPSSGGWSPEDVERAAREKERMMRQQRWRIFCVSAVVGSAVVLGVVLGVLGGTGRLGGTPSDASGEEGEKEPPPPPDFRNRCDVDDEHFNKTNNETGLGNCWVQLGPDITGVDDGDEFARIVSLAGDAKRGPGAPPRIASSAPESRDGVQGVDAGSVWVYELDVASETIGLNGTATEVFDAFGPNVSWTPVGQKMSGRPGDQVVGVLSGDGRVLALGSSLNDGVDGTTGSAGSVQILRRPDYAGAESSNNEDGWIPMGEPIYGTQPLEQAGGDVALSHNGSVVAFSVDANDNGVRAVRVYRFSEEADAWTKLGEDITAIESGDSDDDGLGAAVSLSGDGSAVAVGAPRGGGVGRCSGYVRVYSYDDSTSSWRKRGGDIVGEDGDRLGSSGAVSLSADGRTVAVGSPGAGRAEEEEGNDGTVGDGGTNIGGQNLCAAGLSRGRVDVYSYNGVNDGWVRTTPREDPIILGDSPGDSLSVVSLSADGRRVAAGTALLEWSEEAGYVRVYDRIGGGNGVNGNNNGMWKQLGATVVGHKQGERFGTSLSLSGDGYRLAVGGWTDEELLRRGVVRLYELPWYQDVPDLIAPDVGDRLGNKVSLNAAGTRLAASAPKRAAPVEEAEAGAAAGEEEEAAAPAPSGSVQVYDITTDGTLTPLGKEFFGEPGDDLEGALSGDGQRIVITAKNNNGVNGTMKGAGKVTVYELEGDEWTMLGTPIYGLGTKDKFGKYAAMSYEGNVVAVGAPSAAGRGQARAFQFSTTANDWIQLGRTLEGENTDDEFGWSVALSNDGSILAVGARHNSGNNGTVYRSGHVQVYKYDPNAGESGDFVQVGDDIDGEMEADHIGKEVSLSSDGKIVAFSSSGSDDNGMDSGKIRVFALDETDKMWRQRGQDIHGGAESHELMRAALTSDGRRLVTASHSAERYGGLYTGYVNVHDYYEESDGEGTGMWRRVGGQIWGKKAGENFGWGIHVSADGTRLAAGGPARKGETPGRGFVRLYRLPAM